MLSIQSTQSKKCIPNLLPARINHNGPINDTARYWSPTTDEKGTQHVHFRGRHLYGTDLSLPEKYTGAVLNITDKLAPQSTSRPSAHIDPAQDDGSGDEEMEDEDTPEEVKIAEQFGEFDSIIVWGHGGEVDVESDMYVRGMKEWVGFAESMHCDSEEEEGATQTGTNGESSTLQKDW